MSVVASQSQPQGSNCIKEDTIAPFMKSYQVSKRQAKRMIKRGLELRRCLWMECYPLPREIKTELLVFFCVLFFVSNDCSLLEYKRGLNSPAKQKEVRVLMQQQRMTLLGRD
jgi:hypothetical protein